MFPSTEPSRRRPPSIPRVSGGVSQFRAGGFECGGYSPRQRGCFLDPKLFFELQALFPASAGVFLKRRSNTGEKESIPRVSGGVSAMKFASAIGVFYSPRQRGCFHREHDQTLKLVLFPASAGVFLLPSPIGRAALAIPRVSGGVSIRPSAEAAKYGYSPRQRGCFREGHRATAQKRLFPASAGVFPRSCAASFAIVAIPRVSGGVSLLYTTKKVGQDYSPRQRGCFLLGMLPDLEFIAIPRVSGGVSNPVSGAFSRSSYSPRQRGCFRVQMPSSSRGALFPASAGIFDG